MTDPARDTSRWLRIAAIASALVGLLWFVSQHAFSIYDDAYIYFRYADNLREGCGLSFNCGEAPVEGFTSPLYLLLLWLGGVLTADVEAWSQLLGPACLGAALVLAIRLAGDRPGWLGAAAAVGAAWVLTADDHLLHNAVSGLETGLAAAAVVGLTHAVLRRDGPRTATWAILGVLLRPECGVFVLLLPMLPWMRTRARVLGVVVPLLVITAIRLSIFGDVLPNTYWAKAGGTSAHMSLGWAYLGECASTFPLLCLAPLALLDASRRREHAFVLLGMAVWCLSFLRTGGDHFAYARLVVPLVPAATALALRGVTELPTSVRTRVALVLALALPVGLRAALSHNLPPSHGFDNVQRWRAVGLWLREHHPKATIATIPVGVMAHASDLPTLDLVGITSAEVAHSGNGLPTELVRRHWLGHERHNTAWVLERAPSLIVTTKFRDRPWQHLGEAKAGFYADWLILQEIKAGRAPYRVYSAEVQPGVHWLMYRRVDPDQRGG